VDENRPEVNLINKTVLTAIKSAVECDFNSCLLPLGAHSDRCWAL